MAWLRSALHQQHMPLHSCSSDRSTCSCCGSDAVATASCEGLLRFCCGCHRIMRSYCGSAAGLMRLAAHPGLSLRVCCGSGMRLTASHVLRHRQGQAVRAARGTRDDGLVPRSGRADVARSIVRRMLRCLGLPYLGWSSLGLARLCFAWRIGMRDDSLVPGSGRADVARSIVRRMLRT